MKVKKAVRKVKIKVKLLEGFWEEMEVRMIFSLTHFLTNLLTLFIYLEGLFVCSVFFYTKEEEILESQTEGKRGE